MVEGDQVAAELETMLAEQHYSSLPLLQRWRLLAWLIDECLDLDIVIREINTRTKRHVSLLNAAYVKTVYPESRAFTVLYPISIGTCCPYTGATVDCRALQGPRGVSESGERPGGCVV